MATAIIVEDMPQALEMLKNDINSNFSDIEVVGTAKSVVEAAKLLRQNMPDILFLDIMLGDGTGFDILEIIPNLTSKIIFVTASDEYAIKAFKFAAIDYILKPYSIDDLKASVMKAKQQLVPAQEQLNILKDTIEQPNKKPQKISLHTLEKISIVDLDTIVRCESDSNNTQFYLSDGKKIFVTKTLKYFADILKEYGFVRVHQSHLINLQYIKEFIKSDGGYIILKDGSNVPVSVRKRAEVLEVISSIYKK